MVAASRRQLPRISLVTPSFNQAAYLEETIASVLAQGYANLDFIVIDGGSNDGSVDIIRRHERWLSYWVSEPDRGQSHAINKGWRHSTGELWTWLNSDDVLTPGTLAAVAAAFSRDPCIGLLYGDFAEIDEHGELVRVVRPGEVTLNDMLQNNRIGQPGTFLRRAVIQGDKIVDERRHFCMDYELWLRLFARTRPAYIPKTLAKFRLHAESKTIGAASAMAAELASVLRDAECPAAMLAARAEAVSRMLCRAAALAWCAGDRATSQSLIAEAERASAVPSRDGAFVECLTRYAVALHGESASAVIRHFFDQVEHSHCRIGRDLSRLYRREAVGFANVLVSRHTYPESGWRRFAWSAMREGTSRQILQLGIDPFLRTIVGAHAVDLLQRLRRR